MVNFFVSLYHKIKLNTMKVDIKKCFTFGVSEEYPNGFVSITKENAEKLSKHGWEISFHTGYYLNFLGVKFKGQLIGFGSWMDNLSTFIKYDEYQEEINIRSQEQLDKFIDYIESALNFANAYKTLKK